MNEQAFTHLDLFSGIGGFTLGFERAGFRTIAHAETDAYCAAVLRKHWPAIPNLGDVCNIYRYADEYGDCQQCGEPYCHRHGQHFADCACIGCAEFDATYRRVDVITAGWPCYSLGRANQSETGRLGLGGERGGLWKEVWYLLGKLRPSYGLFENVPDLLSVNGGNDFRAILGNMAASGYDAIWTCFRVSSIGAPHHRSRLFILAYPTGIGFQAGKFIDALRQQTPRNARRRQLAGATSLCWGAWASKPPKFGMATKLPRNLDRIKSIGNAVAPQAAEIYARAIMQQLTESN